jgi:hypothetical protein
MPIRDIENHLERADARIARLERIETIEARQKERNESIRIAGGIIAALCAIYAVYMQF